MKVAIIHDYLNQFGGAERVLRDFLRIFPDADLYTLFCDPAGVDPRIAKQVKKTSFLDFSLVRRHHRPFIPLMPLAAASLNLGDRYDLILSSSAGYAKGIRHGPEVFHLSYCHTPIRYAWETDEYFKNPFFKFMAAPGFAYLRAWDRRAAAQPHILVANSQFIAGKIAHYYGREVPVVYPAVDQKLFYYDPSIVPSGYWLSVGRLLHYKRFDLVIEAARVSGESVKIVGGGPDLKRLQELTHNLRAPVEFITKARDEELRVLYSGARGLIFPQVEDFGLVAAEAQACGVPVIAFRGGGALEIVEEGITGLFFDEQHPKAIVLALRAAAATQFNRPRIAHRATRFSFETFRAGILRLIPDSLLH